MSKKNGGKAKLSELDTMQVSGGKPEVPLNNWQWWHDVYVNSEPGTGWHGTALQKR